MYMNMYSSRVNVHAHVILTVRTCKCVCIPPSPLSPSPLFPSFLSPSPLSASPLSPSSLSSSPSHPPPLTLPLFPSFLSPAPLSSSPSLPLPSLPPPLSLPLLPPLSLLPALCQGAWKKDEDKALIRVGREKSFRNWKAIAAELEVMST